MDIYHATWNHGIPIFYKRRTVLTICDIIPIALNGIYNKTLKEKINFLLYRASLYSSLKMANQIITISHSSKNDIVKYCSATQNKITSIYLGCDADPSLNINNEILTTHGIGDRFIVYFGGFEKRKNVESLIEAFQKLIKFMPESSLYLLVKKNAYYNQYLSKYKHPKIIFTDYLRDSDLHFLVSKAIMSVYPSLYEGFGLPIIESMKLGVPVITSKNSSLAEIAEKRAHLIDYSNKEKIKDAIMTLLNNAELCAKLRRNGIEYAKKFNWTDTIQKTMEVYRKILLLK